MLPPTRPPLYTARAYLDRYEPGVVDLMLEPEETLKAESARALEIATRLGQPVLLDGPHLATTEQVWHITFPTGADPLKG